MKAKNPFDARLEAQKRMPESVRTASVHVVDTLNLAWAGVQAVFEGKATPEHALTLLPLLLQRSDAERQRTLDEARAHAADASTPRAKRPGAPPADR